MQVHPYKTGRALFAHIELLQIQTNVSKAWGVFNKTSLYLEDRWRHVFICIHWCVHVYALHTYRFNYTIGVLEPIHQKMFFSFGVLLYENSTPCTKNSNNFFFFFFLHRNFPNFRVLECSEHLLLPFIHRFKRKVWVSYSFFPATPYVLGSIVISSLPSSFFSTSFYVCAQQPHDFQRALPGFPSLPIQFCWNNEKGWWKLKFCICRVAHSCPEHRELCILLL